MSRDTSTLLEQKKKQESPSNFCIVITNVVSALYVHGNKKKKALSIVDK